MDNPYTAGIEAAKRGAAMWENPHACPSALSDDFHSWFAGWCYGTQQMQRTPVGYAFGRQRKLK